MHLKATRRFTQPLQHSFSPWWLVWAAYLVSGLLLTLLYLHLPVDGFAGDLESFAASDSRGFLLRYEIDVRETPLRAGDVIARLGGYTLDEWLRGVSSPPWQAGDVIRYHVLRENTPLLLDVPQQPLNFIPAFFSYPPRVLVVLTFFGLGTFILWKRPNDGAAQRLMLFCMSGALAFYGDFFNFQFAILAHPPMLLIQLVWEQTLYGLQYIAALNFALYFPERHPWLVRFPRLLPLLIFLFYMIPVGLTIALAETPRAGLVGSNRAAILCANLLLLCVILVYVRALRTVKDPVKRSQTLWILWSTGLSSISLIPIYFVPLVLNTDRALPVTLPYLLAAFVPISLTIAVLRFRLFDIDLVINRSLVYGAATALLGILFLAAVRLLSPVFGPQGEVIVTLLAAISVGLLFNPVRYRIQRFIDRRLYRFRFDLNDLRQAGRKPIIQNPGLYTGRILGDYEVLGVIGVGGMGEVYQGYHEGHVVAIKTLLPRLADDPEFRTRFEREAATTAQFQHPNIVRYLQSGFQDGIHYLALEFIEGTDLRTYLREQGRLPLEETLEILHDVVAGLATIHAQGFVHRDLKPANIILRPSDGERRQAIVMDFGVAKSPDDAADTGSGAVGTIDYMAPEQIQTAQTIDARADVYALGVMTYEMLTGEVPYKGSPAQVLFAHLQQPAPDPASIVADLPADVSDAILRALSKDADLRYPTVQDYYAALAAY